MKQAFLQSVIVAISAIGLSGCFNAEAPKCSDLNVQNRVKKIYAEQIISLADKNPMALIFVEALPKRMVRIDFARPIKYEENIKMRSCKAIAYFDNNSSANIEYTVQLDEKNSKKFYVELNMDFLDDVAKQGIIHHIFKK